MALVHDARGGDVNPFGYQCKHKISDKEICGLTFQTQYKLGKHKNQAGHKVKKGKVTTE